LGNINYKTLNPCILLKSGKAIKWFDDHSTFSDNPVALAKHYSDMGADELIIFDLSQGDEEHDLSIDIIRKINRVINIPSVVGGNIRRLEDVKKILYAGAKRAILNFSKVEAHALIEGASERFGKDRIGVSLLDFDELFKRLPIIEKYASEILFMHRLDLNSVGTITDIPSVVITDTMEEEEIFALLSSPAIKGVSGRFISQKEMGYVAFQKKCETRGIQMSTFETAFSFSEFAQNDRGLVPVIVQDHKSDEVLMMAFMNEEAYEQTIRSGRMTYYSRSRKQLWVKGETSGNFQYLKSLEVDCDKDTLLAKVEQIGPACHTGNHTCFFQTVVEANEKRRHSKDVLEDVYRTIVDRREHPKEGSYTNYLFDKGVDKILKKLGEEATEIIIAAKNPNPEEIKYEVADFLYHAMVLMVERGVTWEDIMQELADR